MPIVGRYLACIAVHDVLAREPVWQAALAPIAKQDHALDGATTAYTALVNANVAAAAFHDGATTAAKDVYLNVGFPTNTEIDADATLTVMTVCPDHEGQPMIACEDCHH